jgi:hypothetical protein
MGVINYQLVVFSGVEKMSLTQSNAEKAQRTAEVNV